MAEYAAVKKGPVKRNGGGNISACKKKKKKDKEMKRLKSQAPATSKDEETTKTARADERTPAQISYQKTQEKRQKERIVNKATKTHKSRIEEFNRYVDRLTEHFKIPKVSGTK